MNFDLSGEQTLLRESARGALSRYDTLAAARGALDGAELPDLWPAAVLAGWPGLLVGEEFGGAGLGAFEAILVHIECGRGLAPVPLLGHVAATYLIDTAANDESDLIPIISELATGARRAVLIPARPPGHDMSCWSVDPPAGGRRSPAPQALLDGAAARISGEVAFVPGASGADLLAVVAYADDDSPVAVLLEPGPGVSIEPRPSYDASRPLARVVFDDADGRVLALSESTLRGAWDLTQCLIAAESLGATETALSVAVAYAKDRFTFGRPIGSYQGVKHMLVEVLRLLENARSLLYYAASSFAAPPAERALAASCARASAGRSFEAGSRAMIAVHGGVGATWEHDAHLFFRRAQITRRLLGGTEGAIAAVADSLLKEAIPVAR